MTSEVEMKELEDGSDDRGHGNDGRDKEFEITISYNGLDKPLTVTRDELIRDVRTRAVALFGISENQHLLGLFTADGGELQDNLTVKDAKLKKHEKVLLRPSAVRAG